MVNSQKRRTLVQVVYREQPRTVGKILTPVWLCGKAWGYRCRDMPVALVFKHVL